MKKINKPILIIIFFLVTLTINPSWSEKNLNPDSFLYKKEIVTNRKNEYTFFILDQDIYKHSNHDLNDLRIIDDLGRETPYLLTRRMTAKDDFHPNFLIDEFDKTKRILIKNEEIKNLELNRMIFNIDSFFRKSFQLESNFIDVVNLYRIKTNGKIKEKLDVDMKNQIHTEDIIINIRQDEDPINIKDIKIVYNQKCIIFKPEDGREYSLYFKSQDFISSPSYDLNLHTDDLDNFNIKMSNLRSLSKIKNQGEKNNFTNKNNKQDKKLSNLFIFLFIVLSLSIFVKYYIGKKEK